MIHSNENNSTKRKNITTMPSAESKFSLDLVKSYFSQLNPIAQRISNDIDETKGNYGQLWCTLSPNEQNDIINETLIRPELTLRYFDCFKSASSSSSSSACLSPISKTASADSLAAVVLKNINDSLGRPKQGIEKPKPTEKSNGKDAKKLPTNIKQFYAFDGRNLRTFSLQKVGLKIVQDDTLGAYRDEHSVPFSFRTKSQINLRLFTNHINDCKNGKSSKKDDEICVMNAALRVGPARAAADSTTSPITTAAPAASEKPNHDKTSIENYKKLQNELKLNLRRNSKEKPINKNNDTKLGQENQKASSNIVLPAKVIKPQACRPQVKPPPAPKNPSNNNEKSIIVDCKNLEQNAINRNQNKQRLKEILNSNANSSSMSYAVYSDTYFDHGEHTNLMSNFGANGSGILTASSSSAATSDDDDEKTLCEEVKLLDNDSSLRKGFDFLNNW